VARGRTAPLEIVHRAVPCRNVPVAFTLELTETELRDEKWTDREKKIARSVFEGAVAAELASTIADFKARAAAVVEPDDMWTLESYLRERRRNIDQKYDYRYSQLTCVFGRLLREGRIREEQLAGLSEGKLDDIRRVAGL
jgi:Photoprotection regulator fluorescence recovery protein